MEWRFGMVMAMIDNKDTGPSSICAANLESSYTI